MNSLSWIIYAASVFPALSLWSGIIAILSVLVTVAAIVTFSTLSGVEDDDCKLIRKNAWGCFKLFGITSIVCLFFNILAPEEKTIYMIAASEVGGMVVESPETKEVFDELKETVLDQLKSYQTKTKE